MTEDSVRYRIAPDVAWLTEDEHEPAVYLAPLPDGPPLVLRDSAYAVWLGVAETGTLAEITELAAELAGAQPEVVAEDVATLVAQLTRQGLVVAER